MAIPDRMHTHHEAGITGLRAERLSRDVSRMNKRLGLILLLVALPYLIVMAAIVIALASGSDINFTLE